MFLTTVTGICLILLLPALVSADCMCIGTGDPHYLMCDGKTFYDWQGSGLHQVFKTDSVEVQCMNEKRGAVSIIDYCRIRVRQDGCDLIVQAPSSNSSQTIINGDLVNDPAQYSIDPRFQTKIHKKPDLFQMEIEVDGGQITLDFAPFSFGVLAKKINKCSGMCGDCSGPQKRPVNITQFVEPFTTMDAIISGNQCSNLSTALKASNGTSAMMRPLATVAPAQVPDDRVIPSNPVFESESVMKQVYQQCLAGQEPSRMNEDALFASFVESCIYDKSLGPGAEQAAHSTMLSFVTAMNRSRQLSLPDWQNATKRTTLIKLDDILTRTVTKRPEEIRPNSGVTYELKHIYVEQSRSKADYLVPRTTRWSPQSLQVGIPYDNAFSTMASVENSNNTSGMIAQKLRLHFDIEAPVVVIQPPSPNVKLEAKSSPIPRAEEMQDTPRRRRIPIDEEQDQPESRPKQHSPKQANPKAAKAASVPSPASTTVPTPAATTTPAPSTTMPTPAPTPAPTTASRPPVKQFQIATIVRQREVPASEIKEAPPAPEIPLQLFQQAAQPAVQTVLVAKTPAPSTVAMVPAAPVMPVAAVPAMPAQPVAAMPMAAMPAQQMQAMPAQQAVAAPASQGQARQRMPQQQMQQRPANQQRAGILVPQQQMMVQHPVAVGGTPMMVSQGDMGMGFGGMGQMTGQMAPGMAGQMPGQMVTGIGRGREKDRGMMMKSNADRQGFGTQSQGLPAQGLGGQAQGASVQGQGAGGQAETVPGKGSELQQFSGAQAQGLPGDNGSSGADSGSFGSANGQQRSRLGQALPGNGTQPSTQPSLDSNYLETQTDASRN